MNTAHALTADVTPAHDAAPEVLIIDADADFGFDAVQAMCLQGLNPRRGDLSQADAAPAVVVLELPRPDRASLQRIARIRDAYGDVPIICTSHHDQMQLRVLAFELGADDFMVKPFHVEELAARVRVQLRRAQRNARSDARASRHLSIVAK